MTNEIKEENENKLHIEFEIDIEELQEAKKAFYTALNTFSCHLKEVNDEYGMRNSAWVTSDPTLQQAFDRIREKYELEQARVQVQLKQKWIEIVVLNGL